MTKTFQSRVVVVLALFLWISTANAETWRGRIVDVATNEAVVGALVEITFGSQIAESLSDGNGRFTIVAGAGVGVIRVKATGYSDFSGSVASGEVISIQLSLDSESGELVLIKGTKAPLRSASSYALTAETLRALPGSGNDVLKSVQSLPGVARVPFGGGGLVLRGTSPRDSAVYLDGIEVPILYHFGNLASFYPSGLLDSLEVVPSGFGAQYGRAQGGLVTLDSKPGRSDKWRAAGEMSLLDASVRADGPGGENSTWSLGFRRSYVDAVLALALPDDSDLELTVAPRYFDAQLRYDYVASDRDVLSVMLFGSDDTLQLKRNEEPSFDESPDGFRFDSSFWRLGMRWQRIEGDTTIQVTPWLGVEQSELRVGQQGALRDDTLIGLRAGASQKYSLGSHETGIDLQGRRSYLDLRNEPPPRPGVVNAEEVQKITTEQFADIALYQEHRLSLGDWFDVKPGLRVERFGLSQEWIVDPRLALRQTINDQFTIKESIGVYHQPPVVTDKDWGNPKLKSSYSTQADVGVLWKPIRPVSLGLTGFASQSERLPVDVVSSASAISTGGSAESGGVGAIQSQLIEEQFGTWRYREAIGKGRSYGAEFLAKLETEEFFGWVAYTYSRSKRTRDPRMDANYYRYVLDQPNVLTALGSWKINKSWKAGVRFRYSTGNPFTPVGGSYFDSDSQSYSPSDGPILSERLPSFHQLDLRVDRSWKLGIGRLALFLDLQNATNRLNPEGVSYSANYSEKNYTRGLPIFPSFGLELVQ